jgi:DnaK suppressor protein
VALGMDGALPRPAQVGRNAPLFALMHVFFIEKSMTKEKLLAMPADDYMNAEQHAFSRSCCKT